MGLAVVAALFFTDVNYGGVFAGLALISASASSVLVGEVAALSTLHAPEDPSELWSTVVLAAVGFPLLLIGMRMLRTRMQALRERAPG